MIRLGLVGAGRWGRRYIATIGAQTGARLVHLASTNPASAKLVPPECRLSPDWRAAAADRALDGIIVATPPATHLEIALAAIASRIPVLVEKPMTLSVADAALLAERAQREAVPVMVGHTHLFSAAFRELKSRAASLGALLRTRSAAGNRGPYRADTPVLWDWGPHDVAMCLELFGAAPRSVRAARVAAAQLPEGAGEALEIALEFDAGRRADIRVSNIEDRKQRCFEAVCAGGTLVYDDLAADKLVFRPAPALSAEAVPLDGSLPLTNVVSEFCGLIARGDHAHPSLELGLRVVQVLADCQTSIDAAVAAPAA